MAILTVGRLGFDVELLDPAEWTETRGQDEREFTIKGFIRSDSLENTLYLREQILEQQNQLLAVTYSGDTYFDGYFWMVGATINTVPSSYRGRGLFPFELRMIRLGSSSRIGLQSLLTFAVLDNPYTLGGAAPSSEAVEGWHGVPSAHYLYAGNAELGTVVRASESGPVRVYRQIQIGTGGSLIQVDPLWSVEPDDYLNGAAYVKIDGKLRTGISAPNTPTDWEIGNGIIKVTPNATPPRIDTAVWNGTNAYESTKTYRFSIDRGSGHADVGAWTAVAIVRNDPECVILRLQSDGAVTGGAHVHTWDLTLRRGSVAVYVNWHYTEVPQVEEMRVYLATPEAATAVTPTGSTAPVAIRATSNDADGNQYIMGTRHTHVQDTTNGRITKDPASDGNFSFFVGYVVGGSGASAGNGPEPVAKQYLGWVSERVRPVFR